MAGNRLLDGLVRGVDHPVGEDHFGAQAAELMLGLTPPLRPIAVRGTPASVLPRQDRLHSRAKHACDEGDPATLVADAALARETLGWTPRYTDLEETVATAWRWHEARPEGYGDRP